MSSCTKIFEEKNLPSCLMFSFFSIQSESKLIGERIVISNGTTTHMSKFKPRDVEEKSLIFGPLAGFETTPQV